MNICTVELLKIEENTDHCRISILSNLKFYTLLLMKNIAEKRSVQV